ncbi:MAG: AsmA family protein [Legionella sp.]|nr:AsmA family protein [Legionella sp.]
MKFIKNAFLTIIFTLVIAVTSLWAITYWIKPHAFKNIAQKQLSYLTHQNSSFDGAVRWRVFPRPGLQITNVRVGEPEKIDTRYAFLVENLRFNVQIIPLFRGQLVFDQVVLDGFKLYINLDAPPSEQPQKKQASSNTKHPLRPSRVTLKSLLLTNGQMLITHHKTEHATFDNVRLEAWFPRLQHEQVPIQLKAILRTDDPISPLKTELSYQGLIRLAPNNEKTPNTLINNLELDGQVLLQNIVLKHYEFTQANTHLVFNHNHLTLNPLTVSLYNGESIGQLNYQLDTKQLEFNQTGTSLNAEPIFQHLLGDKPPHFKGTLDFSVHALAQLTEPDWLKKSNLNGSFTLKDGTLSYIDLKAMTHAATQTIRNLVTQNLNVIQDTLTHLKPWNMNDYLGNTPFELINLQFKTNDEHLLLYNLLLETKKIHLKGQGDYNFDSNTINAQLTTKISTYDPTLLAIQQVLVQGFPLTVTGTFDDLTIHVDRRALGEVLTKSLLSDPLTTPIKLLRHHIKKLQPELKSTSTSEDVTPE